MVIHLCLLTAGKDEQTLDLKSEYDHETPQSQTADQPRHREEELHGIYISMAFKRQ